MEKIARDAMKKAISETLNELGYKPQDWYIVYESPLDKNQYSSLDIEVGINVDKNETTGVNYPGLPRWGGIDLTVKFNYIRKGDAKTGGDLVGRSDFDKKYYYNDYYNQYYPRMFPWAEIVFEEYANPNHTAKDLKMRYKEIVKEGILKLKYELDNIWSSIETRERESLMKTYNRMWNRWNKEVTKLMPTKISEMVDSVIGGTFVPRMMNKYGWVPCFNVTVIPEMVYGERCILQVRIDRDYNGSFDSNFGKSFVKLLYPIDVEKNVLPWLEDILYKK